ncbi:MAG: MBL fold metallo-hydrolase [Cytophagales bacterium]|nr:MBL fold metallo-hydrolase [Cytophagales bacterium]
MNMINLPVGVTVFERGWLSSNNVLFIGKDSTALVDTGYCTHAEQTLALVQSALKERSLDHIINTHLHSDHCGGNAALQATYTTARSTVKTHIPQGLAKHVASWDETALSYKPSGQNCPRFAFEHTLKHGDEVQLGDTKWQVHAAPGHDQHSIILFEPETRTLISADALWQNGFGVVFQELEGERAFDEVAQTLDVIERLNPQTVIPGHGAVFVGDAVTAALVTARSRLDGFVHNPLKHTRYAAKVLLKYKLLELQSIPESAFIDWAKSTRYFEMVRGRWFADKPMDIWLAGYIEELITGGAARREGGLIVNV